mgnify:CR=1 FL=1
MTHEQIAAMVNRLKLAKITGCRAAYALLGATPLDKINADIAAAADLIEALVAELATLRAERDALPEQLIYILHVLDDEAQTIANRISGMRGFPCQHPDGVQVLEDAETIIRAAFAALKGGA